jgi:antitoxin component of RelBE/YafQ-DinJ toxin-antitoxin module
MVVRSKILYEQVAQKYNLPLDLIESVGGCVFTQLRKKMENPTDLAYELPKFGTFNIRFKMFEDYYESFLRDLNANKPEAIQKRDANPELFSRNTKLYKKIQEYREKKKEIKDKRSEKRNKPREDNS